MKLTFRVMYVCIIILFIVVHTADCGVPLVNRNVKLYYSSTQDGSFLILICENNSTTDEQILIVMCHNNGYWIPTPADFIQSCSSFTTVPPGIVHSVHRWE